MAEKQETRPGPRHAGGRGPRPGRGGKRFFRRRKVDYLSVNRIDHVDYKNVDLLKHFVGERGKINPRRHTGLGAKHQREVRRAVKRARNLALLPFAGVVVKPPRGRPSRAAAARAEKAKAARGKSDA